MAGINISNLRLGDLNENRLFAEKYTDKVFSVAYSVLGSAAQAHYVTVDTFVRAHEQINTFESKQSLSNWICHIAYLASIDYKTNIIRASAPNPNVSASGKENTKMFFSDRKIYKVNIEHDVKVALGILPDDQREVVLLHDAYGFDYDRMEYIMGISEGVLRSRAALARNSIKNILAKRWNVRG